MRFNRRLSFPKAVIWFTTKQLRKSNEIARAQVIGVAGCFRTCRDKHADLQCECIDGTEAC